VIGAALLVLLPIGIWSAQAALFAKNPHEAGRGFRIFSWTYPVSFLVLYLISYGPVLPRIPRLPFALASALLVGAVIQSMIFGHWYFVRPKMNVAPLLEVLRRTQWILGARAAIGLAGAAATVPWSVWRTEEAWLAGGFGDPLVALVHILLGYVGLPLILHGARRCAQIPAVQPATGMLYAAIFFVGFSELCAVLLLARGIVV